MKKLIGITITFVIAVMMSACGTEKKDIDVNALAGELLEKVAFADDLSQANEETAVKLYGIKDAVSQCVYISSGATAEEMAVFELKDEAAAKDAKEAAMKRIEEQKKGFESYIPAEIEKLDKAIVKTSGRYLIVCIANGNEANEIIEKYI